MSDACGVIRCSFTSPSKSIAVPGTCLRFGASRLFLELVIRLGEPMARRGHGGRPYKGDRDHIVTRPSRVVGDLVRQRADEAGLTISDYVASVLARAHGVPEADLLTPDRNQEVLPLGKTA